MKLSIHKTIIVSGAILLAGTAMAGDIYKYVDANGNVHYGDRPSGEPTETRLALVTRSTNSDVVQSQIEQRRERDAAREEARKAREGEEAEAAEARAEAEDRAAKCQENRNRLVRFGEARRLFKQDENGERVYLDESERKDAENRVRELITEYCG